MRILFVLSLMHGHTGFRRHVRLLGRAGQGRAQRLRARCRAAGFKAKVSAIGGRISGIGDVKDSDRYYGLILTGKTAGFFQPVAVPLRQARQEARSRGKSRNADYSFG